MGVAVVFPGQGSQFAGMADPWVAHDAGRSVLERATAAIGRDESTTPSEFSFAIAFPTFSTNPGNSASWIP